MAQCLLGLGSNLGDRAANLRAAISRLNADEVGQVRRASSFFGTHPAGGPEGQPEFLNACCLLETKLSPHALLAALQTVENELGRVRQERWGPRTLDLDLLLYDQMVLRTPELTLPHPRLPVRRFVLEPAAEIAADLISPLNGWTIGEFFHHLRQSPRRIAVTANQSEFADFVRKRLPASLVRWELETLPPEDWWAERFHFGALLVANEAEEKVAETFQRRPEGCPILILSANADQAAHEILAAMQASE